MNVHKKVKSLHITNYYHATSGGISTFYNRMIEEANRLRREVRLIVPGRKDELERRGDYGRVYFVKAQKSPFIDRRYRLIFPWQYLLKQSVVRAILDLEKPDVIEIADKYLLGYLAGAIKSGRFKSIGRPMLVHLSCERMDDNLRAFISGSRLSGWLSKKFISNIVSPMYDFHFANSNYTAQEIIDSVTETSSSNNPCWKYFGSDKTGFADRVLITNCGVDSELFNVSRKNTSNRNAVFRKLGIPPDSVALLYAGRLSPEKNVGLIEKVFRSLQGFYNSDPEKRDFRLILAGDGPSAARLRTKLTIGTHNNAVFTGHIEDKDYLADLYASADIFMHPNPREPFGIGPLEAMASGTPVLVPNSGGVLTYANEDNSWIREPDSESYFQGIMEILNNPEDAKRRALEALNTAARFTWESSLRRNFDLYDRLHAEFAKRNAEVIGFETKTGSGIAEKAESLASTNR